MKDRIKTFNRRVIDPDTRSRWISAAYMIFACAMLLHHVYVTIHFAAPENGAPVFRVYWYILAAASILLGRLWKDKCFWVLAALFALKFFRVAIPMPYALQATRNYYDICLYAFAVCYPVGRVLSKKDRERFIALFCGLWTAAAAVMACIGLYTVWNNAVIPNLGNKVFQVKESYGQTRLWPVYHPVEGGTIASISIAVALVGFCLTRRKALRVLYVPAILAIFLMGVFTASRTSDILTALGLSTPLCLLAYEWKNKGKHRKSGTFLRVAGVFALFAGLSLLLIWLQLQVPPVYNALRSRGGVLVGTAFAESAAEAPVVMTGREFVLDQGLNGFLTGRIQVWETALKALGDHPKLLLEGQSVYKFMAPLEEYGLDWCYHLHSTFFQTLWESGVPGFLLFFGFFGAFVWNAVRLLTDRKAPLWTRLIPLPALLCWIADLVDCTGYCNWGKPPMTILYVFTGLTIAVACERRREKKKGPDRPGEEKEGEGETA